MSSALTFSKINTVQAPLYHRVGYLCQQGTKPHRHCETKGRAAFVHNLNRQKQFDHDTVFCRVYKCIKYKGVPNTSRTIFQIHFAPSPKALYGEGETFTSWLDKMCLVLLSEGFSGMERELQSLLGTLKGKGKKQKLQQEAVESLRDYLLGNAERSNYCERLAVGRPIGSGLIEGACKNLMGRRMKQTRATWRIE